LTNKVVYKWCINVLAAVDRRLWLTIVFFLFYTSLRRLDAVVKAVSARSSNGQCPTSQRRRRQLPNWRGVERNRLRRGDDEFYGATTKDCCDPPVSRPLRRFTRRTQWS